jgi:hypothetical protein
MSEVITCSGCKFEPQIAEIGMFADITRKVVDSMMPGLIDSALDLVAESDGVEANPNVDQQISGVIDYTARMSTAANSIDIGVLSEIEAVLCAEACTEEDRAESLTGCPKLDFLMPKMDELASKIQLPW